MRPAASAAIGAGTSAEPGRPTSSPGPREFGGFDFGRIAAIGQSRPAEPTRRPIPRNADSNQITNRLGSMVILPFVHDPILFRQAGRESSSNPQKSLKNDALESAHGDPMTLPDRVEARPVRNPCPARRGRDGRGLPRAGPPASPRLAIKVLPAAIARDADCLARFEPEARAASALNHPNIVTIYDIGPAAAPPFIARSSSTARPPRARRGRAPPVKNTLQIAPRWPSGSRPRTRRDRSPRPEAREPMFSQDGFVKILDFGLAKLDAPLCREGEYPAVRRRGSRRSPVTVLGTAGYMSPEQAAGRATGFSFQPVLPRHGPL